MTRVGETVKWIKDKHRVLTVIQELGSGAGTWLVCMQEHKKTGKKSILVIRKTEVLAVE